MGSGQFAETSLLSFENDKFFLNIELVTTSAALQGDLNIVQIQSEYN
jgi:hypothetical protein